MLRRFCILACLYPKDVHACVRVLGDRYSVKLTQIKIDLFETACEAHLGKTCVYKGSDILRQCAAHIMATSKLPTSMWQDKNLANNVPLAAQRKWT